MNKNTTQVGKIANGEDKYDSIMMTVQKWLIFIHGNCYLNLNLEDTENKSGMVRIWIILRE